MFQFTRPQGARQVFSRPPYRLSCFNSRAHRGRDIDVISVILPFLFQFTRPQGARLDLRVDGVTSRLFQFTRPQGARQFANYYKGAVTQFQFTRPQGARQFANYYKGAVTQFQFTRPQGARPTKSAIITFICSFNSRAHRGRDIKPSTSRLSQFHVSIHAPTGGATRK